MHSAEWTNADSLDNSILNGPKIGDVPGNDNYWAQQGWVCPKCGAVLAPWVSECPHCKPGASKITTTPGITYKFPDDYVNVDYTKTICKDDFTCSTSSAETNIDVTALS